MKTVFSAIQPSGNITLGNYLGAIKNWVPLQKEHNCVFCVADFHSISIRQDPQDFKQKILQMYALLLACGIDPKKSLFFIQSHVNTHTELAWILNCYTQFGDLSRMTQFKDKSQKHSNNINVGLFDYPVLMAADILLYKTDLVPVGADQKQHLELARNLADKFNNIYGDVFTSPCPLISENCAKISSLQEPTKKMSKSDENENSWISILDNEDTVLKKFKRAVTDSESIIQYKDGKDGINNLIRIYSAITKKTVHEIETEFSSKGYGDFKISVANAVIKEIAPIKAQYKEILKDEGYITKCYKTAAEKAREISFETLKDVKKRIGFVL